MRHLTLHRPASNNQLLAVTVDDHSATDGSGFTKYTIVGFDASRLPPTHGDSPDVIAQLRTLLAQGEAGPRGQGGITMESLLAICCDRLGSQHGPQTPHHQLVRENLNAALMLQRSRAPVVEREVREALPA